MTIGMKAESMEIQESFRNHMSETLERRLSIIYFFVCINRVCFEHAQ